MEVMLNVACHHAEGSTPIDTPEIESFAREVDSVSEEFASCKKDFYFGRTEGLLDRISSLSRKITPMVTRCSTETGVEVGYWPFSENPWLHYR